MGEWLLLIIAGFIWSFVAGRQFISVLREVVLIHVLSKGDSDDGQPDETWAEAVREHIEMLADTKDRWLPIKGVAVLCVLFPLLQLILLMSLFCLFHIAGPQNSYVAAFLLVVGVISTSISWVDNMKVSCLYFRALWSYRKVEDMVAFLLPRMEKVQTFPLLEAMELCSLAMQACMGAWLLLHGLRICFGI